MPLPGDHSASFIVRIWREPTELTAAATEWRGSIEHVGSSERAFFREIKVISEFISRHLIALGIRAEDRFWERMGKVLDSPEPVGPAPPPPDAAASAALAVSLPALATGERKPRR